jgi:hypothetical protein
VLFAPKEPNLRCLRPQNSDQTDLNHHLFGRTEPGFPTQNPNFLAGAGWPTVVAGVGGHHYHIAQISDIAFVL